MLVTARAQSFGQWTIFTSHVKATVRAAHGQISELSKAVIAAGNSEDAKSLSKLVEQGLTQDTISQLLVLNSQDAAKTLFDACKAFDFYINHPAALQRQFALFAAIRPSVGEPKDNNTLVELLEITHDASLIESRNRCAILQAPPAHFRLEPNLSQTFTHIDPHLSQIPIYGFVCIYTHTWDTRAKGLGREGKEYRET